MFVFFGRQRDGRPVEGNGSGDQRRGADRVGADGVRAEPARGRGPSGHAGRSWCLHGNNRQVLAITAAALALAPQCALVPCAGMLSPMMRRHPVTLAPQCTLVLVPGPWSLL